MGERKVLNKYYPPDFDPSKLPRGKRGKHNEMKVRMMLPMSVRCKTCGNFMYKGTKFNTRKEDVLGEDYLGIQVFRFYWRCKRCAQEFTMKTDPKNSDYVLEEGATRNYEPWRDEDVAKVEAEAKKEEEEKGNAMKALENRTLDSKREMDIMSALDEMRSLKSRHEGVDTEVALAALRRSVPSGDVQLEEEDEAAVRQMLLQRAGFVRRLSDSDEDRAGCGSSGARPALEPRADRAGPSGSAAARVPRAGVLPAAASAWQEEGEEEDARLEEERRRRRRTDEPGHDDMPAAQGREAPEAAPGAATAPAEAGTGPNETAAPVATPVPATRVAPTPAPPPALPRFFVRPVAVVVKPKPAPPPPQKQQQTDSGDSGEGPLMGLAAYGSDSESG